MDCNIDTASNAPVVVFVYNRLQYTIETLEALDRNLLADESELYIICDAARTKDKIKDVNLVREYVSEYENRSRFSKVTVYYAEKNRGLANSIINSITEILYIYKKVIVLEDDCVPTQDYLKYMNDALNFYEKNAKIWSVTGYAYDFKSLDTYNHDVYMAWRGCSWGWGTWEDRWKKVDWNVNDYKAFKFSIQKRLKFMRGGNDLPSMLKAQMNGKIDSWAVRWCYAQSKLDMYTVYPKISRINNIGFNSGEHGTVGMSQKDVSMLSCSDKQCVYENLEIDEQLEKEMKNKNRLTIKSRIVGYIELQKRVKKRNKQEKNV